MGQDSVGGDLIIYGGENLFSFSLAKEWISLALPTINERYQHPLQGISKSRSPGSNDGYIGSIFR